MTPITVGPVLLRDVRSAAILDVGDAETEVVVEHVTDDLVRIEVIARARTDVGLRGFDVLADARVEGLPALPVVLAHPNFDQESRGMPSHRMRPGHVVERGYDQALHTAAGTLVVSCEHVQRWVPRIRVAAARRTVLLSVAQQDQAITHVAGAEIRSDPMLFGWWRDPLEGLERHAEMNASRAGALQPPHVPAPRGWNSWDHYGWMLNEDIVRAEAAALPVDDGFRWLGLSGPWFDTFGDWRPHARRFPRGLRPLIDELHARGLLVSLWWAPFLVEDDSSVFQDHPDWLLRDAAGDTLLTAMVPPAHGIDSVSARRCAVLDGSNPAVQEHLGAAAARLTVEYGADSLFTDFLRCAALPAVRQHGTGVEGLRAGARALRDGLADGAMLMGASGPVGMYTGLVHAGRIGPDITIPALAQPVIIRRTPPGIDPEEGFIAANFPPGAGRVTGSWQGMAGICNEVCALATRWYLHGRCLQANPDAVVLGLPLAEARTVATLWAMTGGMLMAAESLLTLPADRRALLTHPALLEIQALHRSARPLDLFTRPGTLPRVWSLSGTPRGDYVAIVNWDDQPLRHRVDSDDRDVYDCWTGRVLERVRGRVTLTVASHDTALLRIATR